MSADTTSQSKPTDAEHSTSSATEGKPKRTLLKVMLGVAAVLAALVLIFLIVVAAQPSEYRVQRSAVIDAPPEQVFAHVNDFHKWQPWSPWEKLDPDAEAVFEGPDSGEGAVFKWSGNDEVGEGTMTIIDSDPHEKIGIRLEFVRPMEDACHVEFTFQPQGEQTQVTWSMFGENNFVGKAMCLFMDLDKVAGGQFEQGLANLKSVVEAGPKG